MSLQGKYALVTGGSRGIGRGIALALAEECARVAINYVRNETAAQETLEGVRARGSDGLTVRADVCRGEEIRQMFARVKQAFGALDIFINNARTEAPTFYQAPLEITLEKWETAIASQATAFLVGVREAAQIMRSGGRIVAITYSQGCYTGSWQPWVAMGAAKSALEVLCRYFAVALAGRGITVNAISPGWTEDSVLNSLPQGVQDQIRRWHQGGWTPMGRLGTPADIGNAVRLLCSEKAAWITGQVLAVDGGSSLMNPALPLEIQEVEARKQTQAA